MRVRVHATTVPAELGRLYGPCLVVRDYEVRVCQVNEFPVVGGGRVGTNTLAEMTASSFRCLVEETSQPG